MTTTPVPAPVSPFAADEPFARRLAELDGRVGTAVVREVAAIVDRPPADPTAASTVAAVEARMLVDRFDLGSTSELALLALPVARELARPPISGYRVAAIGIEAETGDLVLGGNLEFPGTELTTTIHAEGFVSLRARRRGHSLRTLAVSEAHPCAHCRQTLAESAVADGLAIVDPLGHRLSLDQLYPWPFRPGSLGRQGDAPDRVAWPGLALSVALADAASPRPDVASLLLDRGAHAHAPYSGVPSAVVLRLRDRRLLGAGCVESVAFNPSITALQAALVELAALRIEPAEIADAWLARTEGGAVEPEPTFRALLRAVAPEASAHVVHWHTGP